MQESNLQLSISDTSGSPTDRCSPRLPKALSKDFIRFRTLLETFKSNQVTHLYDDSQSPTAGPSFELELDLHSDSEDESSSPRSNNSILRDVSYSSFKHSSPRKSVLKNPPGAGKRRYGSFAIQPSSVLFDVTNNRRISLANVQMDLQAKRRLSSLIEAKAAGLSGSKNCTGKGMFEMIKRNSLKINFEFSPIRERHDHSHPHSNNPTPESPFVEKESGFVKKPSLFNLQPFSVASNDQIDSEPESDSQESCDEELEIEAPAITEKVLKLSFLKYEEHEFVDRSLKTYDNSELRKMNMGLIDEERKSDQIAGMIDPTEVVNRKIMLEDKGPSRIAPTFFAGRNGIITEMIRRGRDGMCRFLQTRRNSTSIKSQIWDFYDFKSVEPSYFSDRYSFFFMRADEKKEQKAFSISGYSKGLFSHAFGLNALKNCNFQKHFQLKVNSGGSRIPLNMYPVMWLCYPSALRGKILPFSAAEKVAEMLREDEIFVKDDFSKKGTFVRLEPNNPIMLREGQLFKIDSKIGFSIKIISCDMIDSDFTKKELRDSFEFICLNRKKPDSELFKLVSPIPDEPDRQAYEKKVKHSFDKEYKSLMENEGLPHLKIEVVKWNDVMNCYEEKGGAYFLYNPKQYASNSKEKWLQMSHNKKNWIDLFEETDILKLISTHMSRKPKTLLGYDQTKNLWYLSSETSADLNHEVMNYEEYSSNSETRDDFEGVLEQYMMDLKVKSGINLNNFYQSAEGGLWLSVSPFHILQDKFFGGWVKIGASSQIKFECKVMKVGFEKMHVEEIQEISS